MKLLTAAEKALDQNPRILTVKCGSRSYKSCTVAIMREALRTTATTDGAYMCLRFTSSGPLKARVKYWRWSWRRTGVEKEKRFIRTLCLTNRRGDILASKAVINDALCITIDLGCTSLSLSRSGIRKSPICLSSRMTVA